MNVNIHEAKTHLSKLIARVINGEEVIISKSGRPVARLISIETGAESRVPGSAKGRLHIGSNFMDPLPDDILESFES